LKHTQTIRLLPSISGDVFPLSSLYPTKSNIKLSTDAVAAEASQTPQYNTSILKDTLHKPHLLWLHAQHKSCPAFRSALALWRIWGDRRGLSARSGGGGEGWAWFGSMVLGFIVQGGEVGNGKDRLAKKPKQGLGRGLSEWQLLRAGWEFLGELPDVHCLTGS
jgi:U3 small nucleolar RNA-associated protein 22